MNDSLVTVLWQSWNSQRLPDYCLMTASITVWRLFGDCRVTVRHLSGDSPPIVQWLSSNCLVTVHWLPADCPPTIWWLTLHTNMGNCRSAVWADRAVMKIYLILLSECQMTDCPMTIWQLPKWLSNDCLINYFNFRNSSGGSSTGTSSSYLSQDEDNSMPLEDTGMHCPALNCLKRLQKYSILVWFHLQFFAKKKTIKNYS